MRDSTRHLAGHGIRIDWSAVTLVTIWTALIVFALLYLAGSGLF